jgi:hypothetical protein
LLSSGDFDGTSQGEKAQADDDEFFRCNEQDNASASQHSSNNPNDDCSIVDDVTEDGDLSINNDNNDPP